ncbi:MAG: gluconate 2-dehydrogenase subunit 3 family protein [Flavobacteriaceae bacterium]
MERREALKLSAGFLGYSLSGLVFSSMLNGCKVDANTDWTPLFFTKEQAITISEMAEHILPRTDTPGAKDILVHRFIDKLIYECYATDAQKSFLEGLDAFQSFCMKKTGNLFEDDSEEEKDAIFAAHEEILYQPAVYIWGNKIKDEGDITFYRQIKGLSLFGYFSSEEVSKNILNYDPVPGKFVGCVPLEEIGNAWAL